MDKLLKIKGYEDYFLCTRTCDIFSKKRRTFKRIKKYKTQFDAINFRLFKNGIRYDVSLFEIMKRVVDQISPISNP